MNHKEIGDLKFALLYEPVKHLVDSDTRDALESTRDDILYICENHFGHEIYYFVDGQPVLFISCQRTLRRSTTCNENNCRKVRQGIILVGDAKPEVPEKIFWYFDAVTTSDIYGAIKRPDHFPGHKKSQKLLQRTEGMEK